MRGGPRLLGAARAAGLAAGALVLLLAPRPGGTQEPPRDERFERVATLVSEQMKEQGIPGATLGIYHGGVRRTRGFGVTSVEHPLPVTGETLFQAGSITKTLTATAVMRLVEDGRVRLDAPVREYLPGFRLPDEEAARATTVRTLLTHTGGWEGDLFDDPGPGDDALHRLVDRMATLEQVAPFGAFWSYNNAGYLAAGRLVEVVTGRPFETALRELVIEPLGLHRTFLFPAEVMTHRFAVGHAGPTFEPVVLRPWALPRALAPAGGVVTNVEDLLRFAEFHLGDGRAPDGSRLLSGETLRLMHERQPVERTPDDGMALGWQVSRIGALRELWHDGAAIGQMALLFLVPSEGLAVAVLTNSVRGERFNQEVRRTVAREYLGVTIEDPAPLPVRPADLAEYAGYYARPFMDVVVTVRGDRVMIQRIQKQGFPRADSPVPPPLPPGTYAVYAEDRLVGVGRSQGERVEFVRRRDGTVGWVRVGGRLARRVEPEAASQE